MTLEKAEENKKMKLETNEIIKRNKKPEQQKNIIKNI